MATDPRTLTVNQGKTYRVVFRARDGAGALIPLTGYGARFVVLSRANGNVLIAVSDLTEDPGNLADPNVQVEPAGLVGEVHVRLGADQTSILTRNCVYDAVIYSKTDATEVLPLSSGPIVLVKVGGE